MHTRTNIVPHTLHLNTLLQYKYRHLCTVTMRILLLAHMSCRCCLSRNQGDTRTSVGAVEDNTRTYGYTTALAIYVP